MCWGGENPGFNPPGGKIWPIKKKRILEKLYMVVDGDCHEGSPLNHISYDVETILGFWTQRANSDQLVMWNKENNSVSKRYSSRIIVPIGGSCSYHLWQSQLFVCRVLQILKLM